MRPSAVAASGAPPITVAGSVQRPGRRSERSVRPLGTSTRATVVAAPVGVAVYSDRQPAAGCPAGSARGRAGAEREGALGAGAQQHEVAGAAGAAACSPHARQGEARRRG